ncbi:MAG: HpaII family restriction endonuclease [Bacteroides sp.]|nr:HpaII family restriction endonuclease [Bacteroides sp.]
MSLSATKKEWSELYVFFSLLARGEVESGKSNNTREEAAFIPVSMIRREEHNGPRSYYIEEENIHITGENYDEYFPREDFKYAAGLILPAIRKGESEEVEAPEELEAFLDALDIYDIAAVTNDRTDFYVAFYHPSAPLVGFCVHSRIGKMFPLLDGGRAANIKFELSGVKFAVPTVDNVNALKGPFEVTDRLNLIERLGGILKYSDVADKVFRSNLQMIDLHFPRVLAEMVRMMHLEGITRIDELTERMKEINPLKIKDELIHKHSYYEYKMKQFLLTTALGMRPAKIFNGADSVVAGFFIVGGDGKIVCYQKNDKENFEEFLYHNTRLERGDTGKDKYGYLERENKVWYFKLNIKVGIIKR